MLNRRTATLAAAVGLLAAGPADARTYYGTVGPGETIKVTNAAGTRVARIPRGLHTFVIRDRSSAHNFHLTGYRVNRATGVSWTGTVRWSVRVRVGRTYRYVCDPHAGDMRGSFRGV